MTQRDEPLDGATSKPRASESSALLEGGPAIVCIWRFLGHAPHGVTEVTYRPTSGAQLTGYFDDERALRSALTECAEGTVSFGLQPRPRRLLVHAPNELRPDVIAAPDDAIECVTTLVLHVRGDRAHQAVTEIAQKFTVAPPLAAVRGDEGLLFIGVSEVSVGLEHRDDVMFRLDQLADPVSALAVDGVEVSATTELAAHVELSGARCFGIERAEHSEISGLLATSWDLPSELPAPVIELLNESTQGKLAKLFKGTGSIGLAPDGKEIDRTGANYDGAFLRELVKQSKGCLSSEELAAAVWLRPGGEAKKNGKRALARMVSAAYRPSPSPPLAPPSVTPAPGRGLAGLENSLWPLYYFGGGKGVKRRHGVPLSDKADTVLSHIVNAGGRLYHYEDNRESVFVVDGAQHAVDFGDANYDAWFSENVRLFGSVDSDGRALTAGLCTRIRCHPACVRAKRSKWGHFDPERGLVYFCLDPAHATLIRVSAAVDGRPVVEEVPNGTDDVLLRCPRFRDRRFQYAPGSNFALFAQMVHAQQALSEIDRLGSTAFNLACLLPDLPQRPLKHHLGQHASGKTTSAADIEYVLYGRRACGDYNEPQALWSMLDSGGPIVTQDNAELVVRKKFESDYRLMATGAAKSWRKLYTNRESVNYFPNGTLVMTSIEGMTSPEDLSRVFEFDFAAEHHSNDGRPGLDARARLLKQSADAMLSSIFDALSLSVLPDFTTRKEDAYHFIRRERRGHSKSRFDEFVALMALWIDAVGTQLWDPRRGGRPFDARGLLLDILDEQDRIQQQARVEGDSCVLMLDLIRNSATEKLPGRQGEVSIHGATVKVGQGAVEVGPITSAQLFAAMSATAKDFGWMGPARPFENPRQLGQRMAAADKSRALATAGWVRHSTATVHGGTQVWLYRHTPRGRSAIDDNLVELRPGATPIEADLRSPIGATPSVPTRSK